MWFTYRLSGTLRDGLITSILGHEGSTMKTQQCFITSQMKQLTNENKNRIAVPKKGAKDQETSVGPFFLQKGTV